MLASSVSGCRIAERRDRTHSTESTAADLTMCPMELRGVLIAIKTLMGTEIPLRIIRDRRLDNAEKVWRVSVLQRLRKLY